MDLTSSVQNKCDALSVLHENFGMGMDINNIKREFRQWVENQITNYPVEKNINVDAVTTHDDKFEVTIDVYQFKSDEITVKVVNSNTICVEGNYEERTENASFLSRHFVRKYTVPTGFDIKNVVSTLSSDGLLRIMAPRNGQTITVQQTKASTQNTSASHNNEIGSAQAANTTQSVSVQQTQSNTRKHSISSTEAKKEVDETHRYIQQFLNDINKFKVVPIQQVGAFLKKNEHLQERQFSTELQQNRSSQQTAATNTNTMERTNTKIETDRYCSVPIVQTKVSSDENYTIQNRRCSVETQEIFQSGKQIQDFEVLKKKEFRTVPIERTNVTTNTEEVSVKKYGTSEGSLSKILNEDAYTNVPIQQTGMVSQVNKVQTNKHSKSKYSTQGQEPNINKLENIETVTECTMYETHNTNEGYKTVPIKQTSTTESHIVQSLEKAKDKKSVEEFKKHDTKSLETHEEIHSKQNYKTLEKEIDLTSQVQECTTKSNNDTRKMQSIVSSSQESLDRNNSKNLITKTESIEESTTYEIYSNRNDATNMQNQVKNTIADVQEMIIDVKNYEGIDKQKICDKQNYNKDTKVTSSEVDEKAITNIVDRNTESHLLNKPRNQATSSESIEESTTCEIYKSSDYKTVPITVIDSQRNTETFTTTSSHANKNLQNFKSLQETNSQFLNKDIVVDLHPTKANIKDANADNFPLNKPIDQEPNTQSSYENYKNDEYKPVLNSQTGTKIITVIEETSNTQEYKNKNLSNVNTFSDMNTQALNKEVNVSLQTTDEKINTDVENVLLNKPIDVQIIKESTTYENYKGHRPDSQSNTKNITVVEDTTNVNNARRTSTSEEHRNMNINNSKTFEGINIQETYDQQHYRASSNKEIKVKSQESGENQINKINTYIKDVNLSQDCNPSINKQRSVTTSTELSEESSTIYNTNDYKTIPVQAIGSQNINDSELTSNLINTQSNTRQNFEEVNTQEVYKKNYNAHLDKEVEQTQTENLVKNSSNLQTHSDKTKCEHRTNNHESKAQDLVQGETTGTDTFTKVTKHQTRSQKTVKNNSIESQYNISTNFEKAENREGDVATTLKSGKSTQEYQTFAIEPSEISAQENETTHLNESQISRHSKSETNKQNLLTQPQQPNVIFQENDFTKENVICDGYKQEGFTNKSAKAEFEAHPHGFKVTNEQSFYTERMKTKGWDSNNANKQLDQAANTAYQVQFSVDSNNSERLSRMPSESSEICIEEVTEENERKSSSSSSGYKRHETSQHVSSNVHVQQN